MVTVKPCVRLLLIVLLLVATAVLVPAVGAEVARVHEVRLFYSVDRGAVPDWVQDETLTLIVDVGPALDVVANADGQPVACRYDGQRAYVSSAAETVELLLSGPQRDLAAIGAVSKAVLFDDKLWAVSMTLDDGFVSQATTGFEYLDRYGYDATIAVVGSYIGRTVQGKDYASAAQLQAVVDEGWRLSNHSFSHLRAAAIGDEIDIMRDLDNANHLIRQAVPSYRPQMFTNPFVDQGFDPVVQHYVDELGFHLYQTLQWEGRQVDPGVIQLDDYAPLPIGRKQIAGDGSQFDQAHGWAVDEPGTHWWLSIHTHAISPACDCVETASDYLYRTYGAGGSDEVWFAPAPAVLDYLMVRDRSVVTLLTAEQIGARPSDPAALELEEHIQVQPEVHRLVLPIEADATIHSYDPNHRYGPDGGLSVRTLNLASGLLRVDLGDLPDDAVVQDARIALYALQETNPDADMCVQAHALLRDWDEDTVSWRDAEYGAQWAVAGASDPLLDRDPEHVGLRALASRMPGWYELDITELVREWALGLRENHGVLVSGSGGSSKELTFASSEHREDDKQPSLTIRYTLPLDPAVPPVGAASLEGQILGWADAYSALGAERPISVTLQSPAAVYTVTTTVDTAGRFTVDGIVASSYDLTLSWPGALDIVREAVDVDGAGELVDLGPVVLGDLSGDGLVGARDWRELLTALGGRGLAGDDAPGDLNADGQVDPADASVLIANYGARGPVMTPAGATAPVPPRQNATLSLSPARGYASAGEPITLTVWLDPGDAKVDTLDLRIVAAAGVSLTEVAQVLSDSWPLGLSDHELDAGDGVLRWQLGLRKPLTETTALGQLVVTPVSGTESAAISISGEPRLLAGGHDVLSAAKGSELHWRGAHELQLPLIWMDDLPSVLSSSGLRDWGTITYTGAISLPVVATYELADSVFEARDVRVQDGIAYLLQAPFFVARSGAQVLDVSEPLAPQLLKAVSTTDRSMNDPDELWVEGQRLVLANKCNGVDVLDITAPAEARQVGNFEWDIAQEVNVKGVHAVGDLLYVADERGMQVVDISEPQSPDLLGVVSFQGAALGAFGEGIWVDGDTAYVAASYYSVETDQGIERRPHVLVVDVSDSSRPRPIAHAIGPILGRAIDTEVADDVLYVAAEKAGLLAFDVSDPAEPLYLDGLATAFAQKIAVHGDLVYVADDSGGLVVVDASDAGDLRALAVCDTEGQAFGVDADAGYAFVADGVAGMQVVSLQALTPTATPSVTPIPTATPRPNALLLPLVVQMGAGSEL